MTRLLVVLLLLLAAAPASAGAPEAVRFAGADAKATMLDGYLFAAGREGRRPAMVLMHGCGGMWNRDGKMAARERGWAERLAAAGFHALVIDSFRPRGVDELCTKSVRTVSAVRDRPFDALGALAWLRGRPEVDPARIGLLGWSNGGTATLATLDQARGPTGFRIGIALYPGCTLDRVPEAKRWAAAVPLLLLLGGADDWTPPRHCDALAAQSGSRGAPITLRTYPDAYHGFDQPSGSVRTREVRNPAWGDQPRTVHQGPDPTARAAAMAEAMAFLNSAFGPD